MTSSTVSFRPGTALVSTLGIGMAGGLVAAVPAVFAWPVVPYLAAWFGSGPVDATWNDGDAAIAFTAAAVTIVVLAAVALGAWAAARRFGARPLLSAVAAVVVAVGVAVLPLTLLLARH